ncbi:hypothetical protein F3N42_03645 [Marinihelvus fidelis]|uniref:Tail assembly chaperone n=1 Tax=Marinihelvus fidelis TaxID=2613842 RepID=A0A5N0THX1_9GAMM|nr:hypothetical protein [Marinihelvus fidelis]KAA9133456.1 hypothetical protein F3N42_03645 [Marinihelvus fidelis]
MGNIHFKGARDTVSVKVTAKLPQDLGKTMSVPFHCKFKVPDRPTAQQITKDAAAGKLTDDEIIREYLVGWDRLLDADEQPVEFSTENLDELLTIGPYQAAIVNGFLELLYGREALRQKN